MHKYLARFPFDLWSRLQEAAAANRRSVNNEIIVRLTRSFEGYRQ